MLTIFSAPKPFKGHIGIIQANAVKSWLNLKPACQIILFGDEEGIGNTAAELGVRHIPRIERNEYGTPLVNWLFNTAQRESNNELMCYVNADIVLMSDFMSAIARVSQTSFVVIGRRTDLDVTRRIDFDSPDWERCLRDEARRKGKLHGYYGIDYFVFPRGLYGDIPPFALGRAAWDNWLVYYPRSLKVPVIDASKVVMIVHQNHDYSHHPTGEKGVWKGPERDRNVALLGSAYRSFGIRDATHVLTPSDIKPSLSLAHLYRSAINFPVLNPRFSFMVGATRPVRKLTSVIATISQKIMKSSS